MAGGEGARWKGLKWDLVGGGERVVEGSKLGLVSGLGGWEKGARKLGGKGGAGRS